MYKNKDGVYTLSPEQEKYRLEHPDAPFDDTGPFDSLKEEHEEELRKLVDENDNI